MKRTMIVKLLCAMLAMSLLSGCSFVQNLFPTKPQAQTPDFESLVDFVIHAEEGKEFRILQLTDIQLRDDSTCRFPDKLNFTDDTPLTEEELYQDSFRYIEELVERTKPDLIIMTGDNVAGYLDHNGFCFSKLVAFMDSLEIPWAPVFGNHDNESAMGVTWQCQQFENAEYCLFKRGEITGNGNYTIGVEQGGKLIKVIYMMDSNGCWAGYYNENEPDFQYNQGEEIKITSGFGEDQIQWIKSTSAEIASKLHYAPSKFLAMHINIQEYAKAAISKGYMQNDETDRFVIDDPTGVDFGAKYERFSGWSADGLWTMLKAYKFDGIFAGHQHWNNCSIVYEGVRLTFGTKTGFFDYYRDEMVGGTLITVAQGGASFDVQHCYVEK